MLQFSSGVLFLKNTLLGSMRNDPQSFNSLPLPFIFTRFSTTTAAALATSTTTIAAIGVLACFNFSTSPRTSICGIACCLVIKIATIG
mmetsp:Transcript_26691/g.54584  ORF Transcript_26691/g.54584 Transcript_26691/m.54584 type:complete len:88 (-) Transcript_26691:1301-1564(-)